MRYNTFLFDFDGTLVDSMPHFVSVVKSFLDEYGIACGDDFVKTITPLGYIGTAEYISRMGVPLPPDELFSQMVDRMMLEYTLHIPAKNNVVNTLLELTAKGYRLNILTASPHPVLDPCLKRLGIWDLFDHVWSCDDFGTTKADPEIYHMAAKEIGLPVGEILFLDDNYFSCLTSGKAGMKVCGVFDASSAEYEMEIRSVADHYIYNFSELQHVIAL